MAAVEMEIIICYEAKKLQNIKREVIDISKIIKIAIQNFIFSLFFNQNKQCLINVLEKC